MEHFPNIYIGVQAYRFGKKDFELGVGRGGQDTSRHFEGGLGPYVQYWLRLVFAKSIFTSILKVLDKFIETFRRSRLFGE